MKKSYINTKTKILCFIALAACFGAVDPSWAQAPVALISAMKGNVFIASGDESSMQKLRPAKLGDHVHDFEEVISEEGAQVSLTDYYDHQFHLAGSGQVKFLNQVLVLKNGYLWVQSFNRSANNFMLQSANGQVTYGAGEAIFSFDGVSGKTQLLAIKGAFQFANLLQKERVRDISEGQFSYIHNDYEDGSPRKPTPIGFTSFKKITGLFRGIDPLPNDAASLKMLAQKNKVKKPEVVKPVGKKEVQLAVSVRIPASEPAVKPSLNRGDLIAEISADDEQIGTPSVAKAAAPTQDRDMQGAGEIIYLRDDKDKKNQRKQELMNYYEGQLKQLGQIKPKPVGPDFSKKSGVLVKVFGGSSKASKASANTMVASAKSDVKSSVKKSAARKIASVSDSAPAAKAGQHPAADRFESSLVNEYKDQMRHSNEVNALINELKTYDQDYKRQY